MEKGKIAVLCVGLLVIVGAIVGLMVADSKDTTVLTIGKTKYDLEDYKSYGKVWYYEQNTALTDDPDSMANYYSYYKSFYKWAQACDVTLSGDEFPAALESGDAETLLADYDLTANEYMRVKTEIATAEKLMNNSYKLGRVPSNVEKLYIDYINATGNLGSSYYLSPKATEKIEDYMKTVDYRVVTINIPDATSGDVSGDNASGDSASGDNVLLDTKLKAQELIAKIKEDMANELPVADAFKLAVDGVEGSSRYNLYNYTSIANGELDSLSRLYANRLLNNQQFMIYSIYGLVDSKFYQAISDAVLNVEKGEFSDLIETENFVAFVYIEDVRDGLEGFDYESFQNEAASNYINSNSERVFNKIIANKYDFNTLPILVRQREEAEKQAQEAANSGDSVDVVVSGEQAGTVDISEQ